MPEQNAGIEPRTSDDRAQAGGGLMATITALDWKLLSQLRSTVSQFGVTSHHPLHSGAAGQWAGGRISRVFRTFNLESRARREISKEKPKPAPRHSGEQLDPLADRLEIQEDISRKDDRLFSLLKEVYIESRDPLGQVKDGGGEHLQCKQEEKRLTKLGRLGDLDVKKVPKGKISTVEALTLLLNM
ncbi:NADH dehydrogenase [ubiquinone] 1 alpha subcomplex assembly factor 4-like [Cuculus canorus]|uniref:NADH dehydrogenase [ubiquinone] 1 alpha subcomplex assembly factor 4-like n=1 Tax=Cuculus canorus TaxID=55661 RepID=UPI0023AAE06B|nr:NADH dehydrogenase [ubiquinone] 1 alpha subcomplex assembly factor 4-like [Cuculus canorus]